MNAVETPLSSFLCNDADTRGPNKAGSSLVPDSILLLLRDGPRRTRVSRHAEKKTRRGYVTRN